MLYTIRYGKIGVSMLKLALDELKIEINKHMVKT